MAGKTLRILATLFLLSGTALFPGCKSTSDDKPLRIALSSGSDNYKNWIHRSDSLAEIIDMKGMQVDSALRLLSTCDAILFTGGEDVVPAYYGKGYDSTRCESNPGRDSLEFALISEAMRLRMPILGVCRGQQIVNVALGGTLIVDIPKDHPGNVIHQCKDYIHCFHSVTVLKGSMLNNITKADTGMVASNHHQAIEKAAPGIRIAAWSADSIAEAIEWADPAGKPFLMAVQWHPERMDTKSPLSMPLMKAFLEAATTSRKK
ncbi:MAG: gamma-glutamyl-gamma-aminobutyrate hydrolase family protein [Lentimicrobiaceae bacterium]|jgi:putative glutamine amidotransferase